MSDLLKVCGLWKNEAKGTLQGGLGPAVKLVILPNKYKNSKSQPDYNLFITKADIKSKKNNEYEIAKAKKSTHKDDLLDLSSQLPDIPF